MGKYFDMLPEEERKKPTITTIHPQFCRCLSCNAGDTMRLGVSLPDDIKEKLLKGEITNDTEQSLRSIAEMFDSFDAEVASKQATPEQTVRNVFDA